MGGDFGGGGSASEVGCSVSDGAGEFVRRRVNVPVGPAEVAPGAVGHRWREVCSDRGISRAGSSWSAEVNPMLVLD